MNARGKLSVGPFDCNHEGEIFLVDKPIGWSSFDVVKKMKSILRAKKIGHAGTLDPQATGLLVVCTGPKTKSVELLIGLEKEYTGTMELGVQTESYDSETKIVAQKDATLISRGLLASTAKIFEGKQLQKPPMYSAAKYGGKPLYYYARKGRTVERAGKEIEVKEFEITSFVPPFVEFRVTCSKGTYVRSLVHDVGIALGCGATLRSLRRTRVGTFHLEDALTMEELVGLKADGRTSEEIRNDYSATA
ncbi:MAG TPA: tRNA pseudouridine(55) synthase TruB [Bacteroidota bacterium]|nr:tRNA pseudouridine(55) synthase TruB [Bacteroidota bacterium]